MGTSLLTEKNIKLLLNQHISKKTNHIFLIWHKSSPQPMKLYSEVVNGVVLSLGFSLLFKCTTVLQYEEYYTSPLNHSIQPVYFMNNKKSAISSY